MQFFQGYPKGNPNTPESIKCLLQVLFPRTEGYQHEFASLLQRVTGVNKKNQYTFCIIVHPQISFALQTNSVNFLLIMMCINPQPSLVDVNFITISKSY